MQISWPVFFAMWIWTLIVWTISFPAGGSVLGVFLIALVCRLAGYERGWRILTVMPFVSSFLMLLMAMGHY